MLTQKYIHEIFSYDNGQLIRRTNLRGRNCRIGDVVGTVNSHGYRVTKIGGKIYTVHRLIYFYHHGVWPEFIDHINRNRDDNRIENLRSVTRSENGQNRVAVGYVEYRPGKWRAYVRLNGKLYYTSHRSEEEAKEGRKRLKEQYHVYKPTI